jgi:hypothetical protein
MAKAIEDTNDKSYRIDIVDVTEIDDINTNMKMFDCDKGPVIARTPFSGNPRVVAKEVEETSK